VIDFKPILLLVDDMQVNLVMLSAILKDEYHIKTARSATQAMEIISLGGIDMILLDVVMSNMNGYTLCTLLKNDEKTQDIPIIFVIGNSSREDEERVFLVGAVDYIKIPFESTIVKSRVKTHLNFRLRQIELDTMNRIIQEQNEKLKLYQKSIDENIITSSTDIKGNITYVSEAFCERNGYIKEELLGKNHNVLRHPDMPKEIFANLWNTISQNKSWSGEIKNLKKDGGFYWVNVLISPLFEKGKKIGYTAIRHDITLAKEYETKLEYEVSQKTHELQKLNNNLENKIFEAIEENKKQQTLFEQQSRLASLGEMIGNIAHQWRQPLSIITAAIGGLQIKQELLGIPISKEILSEVNDTIINQANYLSKTIDDFRDFIKKDSIQKLFNLSKVIHDVENLLNGTLKSNHIKLIFTLDDAIVYNGQPSQLSQVLLNIVNNAKDAFKENNQTKKQIKIKTFQDEKSIKIEISDNAGGIPEEIKSKVFEPYFTTKDKNQGTGLGLYICTNIIQQYFNGKITIEDVEEIIEENSYKGTKFIIEFEANQTRVHKN
jgi:PAS domain S-box-containing protein